MPVNKEIKQFIQGLRTSVLEYYNVVEKRDFVLIDLGLNKETNKNPNRITTGTESPMWDINFVIPISMTNFSELQRMGRKEVYEIVLWTPCLLSKICVTKTVVPEDFESKEQLLSFFQNARSSFETLQL